MAAGWSSEAGAPLSGTALRSARRPHLGTAPREPSLVFTCDLRRRQSSLPVLARDPRRRRHRRLRPLSRQARDAPRRPLQLQGAVPQQVGGQRGHSGPRAPPRPWGLWAPLLAPVTGPRGAASGNAQSWQVTQVTLLLPVPAATYTGTRRFRKREATGGVWGHAALLLRGQSREGGLVTSPFQTRGAHTCRVSGSVIFHCWADGRVGCSLSTGRVHLRDTLVLLPVGGSCSSDPRWPWQMKATTRSCAGSRRGPGAGESPSSSARP